MPSRWKDPRRGFPTWALDGPEGPSTFPPGLICERSEGEKRDKEKEPEHQ